MAFMSAVDISELASIFAFDMEASPSMRASINAVSLPNLLLRNVEYPVEYSVLLLDVFWASLAVLSK